MQSYVDDTYLTVLRGELTNTASHQPWNRFQIYEQQPTSAKPREVNMIVLSDTSDLRDSLSVKIGTKVS